MLTQSVLLSFNPSLTDIGSPQVLVVEVVSVFPDITREKREAEVLRNRVFRVGRVNNLKEADPIYTCSKLLKAWTRVLHVS